MLSSALVLVLGGGAATVGLGLTIPYLCMVRANGGNNEPQA